MYRQEILKQIKQECLDQYQQITDWVHDINHVKRVVKWGRKLAILEKMKAKDVFLVELACWLHDLGRVGEIDNIGFKSNHAEVSYEKAKQILKPYQKFIGLESMAKLLQAVREHSLAYPIHPENKILRILMDADRGAGINAAGIPSALHYFRIVKSQPIANIAQARRYLPKLIQKIKQANKCQKAIEKLLAYKDWYYGSNQQLETNKQVIPLYSHYARKLYKKPLAEILNFIDDLKSC